MDSLWPWLRGLAGIIGAALIVLGVIAMRQAEGDILIKPITIGATPATIFEDEHASAEAPTVIIAHGFAGSQQLMRPLALSLAKLGYRAFTFDFLGHGRHPHRLMGDITKETGATVALMDQIAEIAAYARKTGGHTPRLALVGHSMAADVIVRAAQADPGIAAAVAISIYSPAPTATSPRNFLIVTGEYEQALRAEALRIVRLTAPGAQEGSPVTTSDAGRRSAEVAPGVEHISVLYSTAAMAEIAAWLDKVFTIQRWTLAPPSAASEDRLEQAMSENGRIADLKPPAPLSQYGPWLLALIGGVALLAWPLSRLLPQVVPAAAPAAEGAGWSAFLLVAILPAVVTPLTLWTLQISFLPVLVADYLAQHFALYGALTALGVWMAERRDLGGLTQDRIAARQAGLATAILGPKRWRPALAGAALVAGYAIFALGAPIDSFGTSFTLTPQRLPLFLAMLAGALLYFIADERLTRQFGARRPGAYVIAKLCFLLSLAAAIALDLERLFFLIIIAPVILAAFILFGLFGAWSHARTRDPWVGGAGVGAAVAWALAATFPLVGG